MLGNQKMTREEIMALPHRELDALVAKNIEGLPVVWGPDPYQVPDRRLTDRQPWIKGTVDGCTYDWVPVKRYSTDWNAMKPVVERMFRLEWRLRLWSSASREGLPTNDMVYYADFTRVSCVDWAQLPESAMQGEDAPLAVVRAAVSTMCESTSPSL